MTELANCTRCDAVFVKTTRDICPTCYQVEEAAFQKVYKFLTNRKNREATIQEIVGATKVEEKLIFKFMKEQRLRSSDFPKLTYPCEKCGKGITEGKLCFDCTTDLRKAIEQHEEQSERFAQREEREEEREAVYFALNRERDK